MNCPQCKTSPRIWFAPGSLGTPFPRCSGSSNIELSLIIIQITNLMEATQSLPISNVPDPTRRKWLCQNPHEPSCYVGPRWFSWTSRRWGRKYFQFQPGWWTRTWYLNLIEEETWTECRCWYRVRFFLLEHTRLRSNSGLGQRYSDFGREWEDVEGVESIGNVGEGDDKVMGFANGEIFEEDGVGFGDKGSSIEVLLFFGHVESVFFEGLLLVLFFELGELADVENFVAVFVVFDEWLLGLVVHGWVIDKF